MLHSALKKKFRVLLSAMTSRVVPIQYLSESANPPQQTSLKRHKTEESVMELDLLKSVSPIGYIKSCFKSKNGTPRQPSVCTFSRAKLQVLKSVFVCPDHSLQGLEQFSHVWIMFLFHKNGPETFTKAKVKPPRLNGAKVGVFATRSPHRPNPIGLTLAKLDKVQGGTLYLSGVDVIDGTPVLDIKPYVPTYDNPDNVLNPEKEGYRRLQDQAMEEGDKERTAGEDQDTSNNTAQMYPLERSLPSYGLDSKQMDMACDPQRYVEQTKQSKTVVESTVSNKQPNPLQLHDCKLDNSAKKFDGQSSPKKDSRTKKEECTQLVQTGDSATNQSVSSKVDVKVADWIKNPPISKLKVQFTQKAEQQLSTFQPLINEGTSPGFHTLEFFKDREEARQAICEILAADPRSTYRRKECSDRLYFFAVDTIHVTCWFYEDIAEVIRIQPLSYADIPS